MARSGTEQRMSPKRRSKPATPTDGAKSVTKRAVKPGAKATVARKGAKAVAKAATPGVSSALPVPKGLARKAAKKTLGVVARKTAEMSAEAIRRAGDQAAVAGRRAIDAASAARLPIQLSIDVAVPIHVAWGEWISWGVLPEGVHRIEDVERDGNSLLGKTAGPRGVDWEAEIQDEREDESFAWRSVAGTDVAGLATFHQISDRLTRIELDLDVVPTNPTEALTLATHLAHRHAAADLRRFKAHVEFINPDVYETNGRNNGGSSETESDADNGERPRTEGKRQNASKTKRSARNR
jgi:uncharacterized membrane protein